MQLMVCGTRLVMWLNALIQLHRMLEWARSCRNVLHRSCRNILEILQHVAIYCTVRTIPWCVRLHGVYYWTVCTSKRWVQLHGAFDCIAWMQLLVCGKLKRLEMRSNALMRLLQFSQSGTEPDLAHPYNILHISTISSTLKSDLAHPNKI